MGVGGPLAHVAARFFVPFASHPTTLVIMRVGLVQGLIQGNRVSWAMIAALWLITAALVTFRRSDARGRMLALGRGSWTVLVMPLRTLVLLAVTTAVSLWALPLATAVSLPRVRWKAVEAEPLVAPGGETWRRLRGPAVRMLDGGMPEVAVPSIDAEGRWVLFGLLSGRPIKGLPPAPEAPIEPETPRLCRADGDACRAWPRAWPDPARAPASRDLLWTGDYKAKTLAYDVESGLYLQPDEEDEGPRGEEGALELIGSLEGAAPREPIAAVVTARRIGGGRLSAARVLAVSNMLGRSFQVQRADVSLRAGPEAFSRFARPVLLATSTALPAGVLFCLGAPLWFRRRLRRRGAVRRALEAPLSLSPISEVEGASMALARAEGDADLGDALLTQGTVVSIASTAQMKEPIVSRVWFELPVTSSAAETKEGSAVRHDERGTSRKVGALVPGDVEYFKRAAAVWFAPYVDAVAVLAAGVAAAAPAVVAMVSLWGSR